MEYIHDSTAYPSMVAPENGLGGSTFGGGADMVGADAPFAAKELDAVLADQLPASHQLIVGLLFWTGLCLFLACDARVAVQHVETASFATERAIEPVACHAAPLLIAGCDRVLAAKSLPDFQHQGRCQMHPLMTYIHLCAP